MQNSFVLWRGCVENDSLIVVMSAVTLVAHVDSFYLPRSHPVYK